MLIGTQENEDQTPKHAMLDPSLIGDTERHVVTPNLERPKEAPTDSNTQCNMKKKKEKKKGNCHVFTFLIYDCQIFCKCGSIKFIIPESEM